MSSTDEQGMCLRCGGHGSTHHSVTEDSPDLTPLQRRKIARGQDAFVSEPCGWCDGRDRVTPLMESRIESSIQDV